MNDMILSFKKVKLVYLVHTTLRKLEFETANDRSCSPLKLNTLPHPFRGNLFFLPFRRLIDFSPFFHRLSSGCFSLSSHLFSLLTIYLLAFISSNWFWYSPIPVRSECWIWSACARGWGVQRWRGLRLHSPPWTFHTVYMKKYSRVPINFA